MKLSLRPVWVILSTAIITLSCSLFSLPSGVSPTAEASAVPTLPPEPSAQPVSTGLPAGFVANNNGSLQFYNSDGQTLFSMSAPDEPGMGADDVHIAGKYVAGTSGMPLIYHSFMSSQNGETLKLLNGNEPASILLNAEGFIAMAGAPGSPVFSYSTVDYQNLGQSFLFVGTLAALPTSPVLTKNDPDTGWVLKPLAVKVENFQPVGVWYTTIAYGIGGDIVFEPRRGLYYLDLATSTKKEVLSTDFSPSGLSFDQNWVAYNAYGSISESSTLMLRNLATGASASFPLKAVTDPRGAGDAVFSPGERYLAWMEGSGWQMAEVPTFHALVRVGDLQGNVVAEFPDTALQAVSGFGSVGWAEPAGWLDDQTLIILVRGEQWDQAALLRVDMNSGTPSYLAPGTLIGLFYQ
jgi:hypothetical protein